MDIRVDAALSPSLSLSMMFATDIRVFVLDIRLFAIDIRVAPVYIRVAAVYIRMLAVDISVLLLISDNPEMRYGLFWMPSEAMLSFEGVSSVSSMWFRGCWDPTLFVESTIATVS